VYKVVFVLPPIMGGSAKTNSFVPLDWTIQDHPIWAFIQAKQ